MLQYNFTCISKSCVIIHKSLGAKNGAARLESVLCADIAPPCAAAAAVELLRDSGSLAHPLP